MTSQTLRPRIYRSLESLAALQPQWEDLLSAFPAASIFSSPDWLFPWWRAFGAGRGLVAIGFFDDAEQLIALAPLSVTSHRVGALKLNLLRLMGDGSRDSDNLDMPVRPGYEQAAVDALLALLEKRTIPWDICRLNTLPEYSPAGNTLLSTLGRRRWYRAIDSAPWLVVNLPGTWEEYLAKLSSEDRNNLQRYARRMEKRYQVRIYRCSDEDLTACLESLFCLHQKRWQLRGEPGTFASGTRRSFYDELSRILLAKRRLEFWLLDLDGKTVAAQFCFRYDKTVYLLQEGFDPDYSADRVGFILRGHVLRQLVEAGVERYDFLFGESSGKERWMPTLQSYRYLEFAKPFSVGSAYLRLAQGAGNCKVWLRGRLPRNVWRALHEWKSRFGASQQE